MKFFIEYIAYNQIYYLPTEITIDEHMIYKYKNIFDIKRIENNWVSIDSFDKIRHNKQDVINRNFWFQDLKVTLMNTKVSRKYNIYNNNINSYFEDFGVMCCKKEI